MVEHNHDEERLARIEHMVERLQREQTALTILTAKLIAADFKPSVVEPSSVVVTYERSRRRHANSRAA
jgi:hypothetical protein